MSTVILYNGVNYTIPATDDVDWGDEVTKFLVAIPNGMLTKTGGAWHLTDADLDLGSAYGLSSLYYKTKTSTPALSGILRLAKGDFIAWRNEANSADLKLGRNSSNFLTWEDIALVDISSPQELLNKTISTDSNTITGIRDVNIASDALISWSKINFDGDFGSTSVITAGGVRLGSTYHVTLDADPSEDYDFIFPDTDGVVGQALVKGSGTKLEWATIPGLALPHNNLVIGDPTNLPTTLDTSVAGDVLADDVTGLTIKNDVITDAMINSAAAIALSKLAALTASRAVVTDTSGFLAASTVTAAELGWVSGVTSGIQSQINTITGNVASLQTYHSDTKEPMGLVVLPTPPTVTYLGSRQIKIAHPFAYYYKGVKVSSVADITVTVPNTTGLYGVCFTDAALTAVATTSVDILEQVLFAGFYWNATTSDYMFFEERHGLSWSANEHKQAHLTQGARYQSGGAASGYTLNSDTLANVQIAVDSTISWDEDIVNLAAAKLVGDNFDKWYRSGANGDWTKFTSDTIPAFHLTNIPRINTFSATWSLSTVTNNNFFNVYLFHTNSAESTNRYILIPGQAQATSAAGAQALTVSGLNIGSLPVQELVPLYQIVLEYKTSYTGNNARIRINSIIDIRRTTSPSVALGISTNHNSLSGRSDADSHPVSAITGLNGETASATTRVTLPQDTLANLTALPRKAGTIYYATDTKKDYYDDGSVLKLLGGGLVPTPIDKDYATTLETGKNYVYNGINMSVDVTLNMPAIQAESNIKITAYNIPSGKKLIVAANGSDKFRKDDTQYSTVEFVATEVEQSAEFVSNNTEWIVDDGSNALGTVWSGNLAVTGSLVACVSPSARAGSDSAVTLTSDSQRFQVATLTAARVYKLPSTGILAGDTFTFINRATNDSYRLNLQASADTGTTYVDWIVNGKITVMALQDAPTAASHWATIDAVSDWYSYSTTVSTGTWTTTRGYCRRLGDTAQIKIYAGPLTNEGSGLFTWTLPTGISADYVKLGASGVTPSISAGEAPSVAIIYVGRASINTQSGVWAMAGNTVGGTNTVAMASTTTLAVLLDSFASPNRWFGFGSVDASFDAVSATVQIEATIPITEWSMFN